MREVAAMGVAAIGVDAIGVDAMGVDAMDLNARDEKGGGDVDDEGLLGNRMAWAGCVSVHYGSMAG